VEGGEGAGHYRMMTEGNGQGREIALRDLFFQVIRSMQFAGLLFADSNGFCGQRF
jgi:hypothetical protein